MTAAVQSAGVRRIVLHAVMVVALICGAFSAVSAPRADELLGKARERAAKEDKTIFVDFSASW